jgi:2-(1,2-epoxy-1,2-dihydrophenyl)acetyl-CoA isomerase
MISFERSCHQGAQGSMNEPYLTNHDQKKGTVSMPYTHVLLEIRETIAYLTLNRPEALNALNLEMAQELMGAAMECDGHPAVRAVVLAGAGNTFCAGGDLKSFAAQGERLPRYLKELTTALHAAVSYLVRMDAPVIAAVQGSAAGAGMSLACACDLVVAGASTRFTSAYTRLGLTPDGSLTYVLPRVIGMKRALELTLTNRTLSAQEAAEWGIVTAVVPDSSVQEQAEALARHLSAGPTMAFGMTKRLLQHSWTESLETQMRHESHAISTAGGSADAQEGIAAFLAKRSPVFKGR